MEHENRLEPVRQIAPREIIALASRGVCEKPGIFRTSRKAIHRLIIPIIFGIALYACIATIAYMSFKTK